MIICIVTLVNIAYRTYINSDSEKKHSTVMTLLKVIDQILKGLDRRDAVAAIYLHLQRTLDTVDSSMLLQKINNHGIRGSILK
jgi:hypothetical protein